MDVGWVLVMTLIDASVRSDRRSIHRWGSVSAFDGEQSLRLAYEARGSKHLSYHRTGSVAIRAKL